eukprot:4620056-Pyramimonas_sp.AAC.3
MPYLCCAKIIHRCLQRCYLRGLHTLQGCVKERLNVCDKHVSQLARLCQVGHSEHTLQGHVERHRAG